jgi:3',5'-cyclic-nucleotide phosphodiesterase
LGLGAMKQKRSGWSPLPRKKPRDAKTLSPKSMTIVLRPHIFLWKPSIEVGPVSERDYSVKFHVIGCSGGQAPGYNISSYLVNDSTLIDAGSAAGVLNLKSQKKIKNILITHVHLDHVMALGGLVENLYGIKGTAINVWGIDEAVCALKRHFFNDTLWPDFTRITGDTQPTPVLAFQSLPEEKAVPVGDLAVTAVRVNHIIPSVAFFIESEKKTFLHVGDTGPAEKVWSIARLKENLCAVVLEASLPNRLQDVADISRHLTPRTLVRELDKLGRPSVPILVTHLKPLYRQEIMRELKRVKGYRLRILKDGDWLRF